MSTSPTKHTFRQAMPNNTNFDPSPVKPTDSPDKTRSLRRLQSHTQLTSTQPTMAPAQRTGTRNTLTVRPSREQLNAPSPNPPAASQTLPSRTRAHSDAPQPFEKQPSRFQRKPLTAVTTIPPSHARKSSLETLFLRDGPPKDSVDSGLALLRHSILTSGVDAKSDGMSEYRIYLWLALLNLPPFPTDEYLALVHRGRSPAYEKIKNDVFRTLATDPLFKRRVTDASLTRVLNATAWRIHDSQNIKTSQEGSRSNAEPSDDINQRPPSSTRSRSPTKSSRPGSPTKRDLSFQPPTQIPFYIQGLNVLTAPLLYASRSEAQSYALLTSLLTTHIPIYLTPSLSGVHTGLALVDKVLSIINPTLSTHLLVTHNLPAKIYAFPSVLTLCACTPPLPEVLKLWDFLFAFGTGLNVVAIVAQLLLLKDRLMAPEASPGKILRSFPPLDAKKVVEVSVWISGQLSEDVYEEVIRHGYAVAN